MSEGKLRLFSVCHLNLAYSSIEEEQRAEVIRKCYWPLLNLARELQVPFGIEASAYTLQCIHALDPDWIEAFKDLCASGTCEPIGSGYAQLIGPLVPPEVNAANLRLGNIEYKRLLGVQPRIALVNEQAYAAGLLQHYVDAGYQAIVMEWDNPARWHPEWNAQWRYLPQIARGQHGEEIALIWNKSIAFQKFQRLAHGEMDFQEYLQYLESHLSPEPRAFPLYGNDLEVFDFRPGRFHTEPKLEDSGEWSRIRKMLEMLQADERFQFILPSQVLELLSAGGAGNRLQLESAEDPVPVKKQEKYNITRWAVTGRNDLGINTACHRLCKKMKDAGVQDDADWRELCYLWSSDFRTHITEKRWAAYVQRLAAFEQRHNAGEKLQAHDAIQRVVPPNFRVTREGRFLKLETDSARIVLNCRRGLAIDSLVVKQVSSRSLLGTLSHGYYQDISLGADYYSGHLVLETPGQPKLTDLSAVEPMIGTGDDDESVIVEGILQTPLGPIHKRIRFTDEGEVGLEYVLQWEEIPPGALRLAHITVDPEAFDSNNLEYRTHNGGIRAEQFQVGTARIDHGRSVSFLVSATAAVGMTGGALSLGDGRQRIEVQTRMDSAAVVGQITFVRVPGSFFYRASFSAIELDETSRKRKRADFPRSLAFTITAKQVGKSVSSILPETREDSVNR